MNLEGPEAWDELTDSERETQYLEFRRLMSFEKRLESLELESYRRTEALLNKPQSYSEQVAQAKRIYETFDKQQLTK